MIENYPLIGVAVIVLKGNKILIGKDERKGNVYGVPGGHLENKETLKECAIREVREESGIICKNPELVSVYEFYREDKGRTYVSLGMKANYSSGVPKNLESEKRFDWDWYSPEDASKLNLFPPDKILIQHYLSGIIYE